MIAEIWDGNKFVSPRYVFGSNFEVLIMSCFRYFTLVKMIIIDLAATIKDTVIVARYSRKQEMDNGYMYVDEN